VVARSGVDVENVFFFGEFEMLVKDVGKALGPIGRDIQIAQKGEFFLCLVHNKILAKNNHLRHATEKAKERSESQTFYFRFLLFTLQPVV
jgi:hypothetical protein